MGDAAVADAAVTDAPVADAAVVKGAAVVKDAAEEVGKKRNASAAELPEDGPDAKAQVVETEDAEVGQQRDAAATDLPKDGPDVKPEVVETVDEKPGENDQEVEAKEEAVEADKKVETEKKAAVSFPITLGVRKFDSVDTSLQWFRNLATSWPEGVLMNEFEHGVLVDLLRKCHPRPRSKIIDGVVGFKVRVKEGMGSKCFHVVRKDGSEEDFSYLKCLSTVAGYDLVEALRQKKNRHSMNGGGGRGVGGGRGRGRGGGRGRSGGRTGHRGRMKGKN